MKITQVSARTFPSPASLNAFAGHSYKNQIYVYPIKALRGIRLDSATLGPQGVEHDRRFMLLRVDDSDPAKLTKVQIDAYPQCGLFSQEIIGNAIHVRYVTPKEPLVTLHPLQEVVLEVPLHPETLDLETADIDLHLSMVTAYHMGKEYDDWFSACFGFKTALFYIGEGRRPVLGTFAPQTSTSDPPQQRGWLSTLSGYIAGSARPAKDRPWIAFSDLAPFLVASEKSLANVKTRLAESDVDMTAFRPNFVVDGEVAFDEDFWAELSVDDEPLFTLTKMCHRCPSLNVDYNTGRVAEGERGTLLKKLMSDRRVDRGFKYAPIFGKYAFLADGQDARTVAVGDQVTVTGRTGERPVYDWPLRSRGAQPQFYNTS